MITSKNNKGLEKTGNTSRVIVNNLEPVSRDEIQTSRLHLRVMPAGWIYACVLLILMISAMINVMNLLVLLFGLMIGPFAFSIFFAWNSLRGIQLVRHIPQRVEAGEPFSVEINITKTQGLTSGWALTVEDYVYPLESETPVPGFHPRVWFLRAVSGHTIHGNYRAMIAQRGRYRFGALKLSTRFPLGLFELNRFFVHDADLIVFPRLGKLNIRRDSQSFVAPNSQTMWKSRTNMQGSEYHSLRDFRPGDNPRWIHWRTTARVGEPMIREFDDHQRQKVIVVLDPWIPKAPTLQETDHVELAVSCATTLCTHFTRSGHAEVQLLVGSPAIEVVQGMSSHVLLQRMLDLLATVHPSSNTSLNDLLRRTSSSTRDDTRMLIISTRTAPLDNSRYESSPLINNSRKTKTMNSRPDRQLKFLRVGSHEFSDCYQIR